MQSEWLIPVSLLICTSMHILLCCTVLPICTIVAAKTKAAPQIISLKSSSKLHPVCPMPAGPGDCAGLLIHLKAEDLCRCFQGAWPTSNAHAHMHKNNQQHKNAAAPHKHTHTYRVISQYMRRHKWKHVAHALICTQIQGRCLGRRRMNQEIYNKHSQVGSDLWILYRCKRGQKENSNLNLQSIYKAQPEWIYWRGVNSYSSTVQLHFLL